MQQARAKGVGSTMHRVTVKYDGSELSFQDPTPIVLAEGDILILHFQGIPNDMIPGAAFSRDGDDFASPLGPFQEALQTADFVVLRGNSGWKHAFQCKALLSPKLRGEEPPLSSANALEVDNHLGARPAKEIRVLVSPKPGSPEMLVEVTVDLEEVDFYAPDSVVWNFVFAGGLKPRDYEPLLYLASMPSPPDGTGPFGPFQSLSVAGIFAPLEEDTELAYRLITAGNNGIEGRYHFNVGVRSTRAGIRSLCPTDPIIDNIGPPHT